MASLLIHQPPIHFLVGSAIRYGVKEAIVLQRLSDLLASGQSCTLNNGKRMVKITFQELQDEHFPFLSIDNIKRIVKTLQSEGAIETCTMGGNDFTTCYSLL